MQTNTDVIKRILALPIFHIGEHGKLEELQT